MFPCLNKHRSALRGTPGSACPQPEPNATELPSCAPISARDAQRRQRRWWRGDEGARRPGPEAKVLRHVLWHALHNALRNCAASLACSSFTCRLGKVWGAVEHDACGNTFLSKSCAATPFGSACASFSRPSKSSSLIASLNCSKARRPWRRQPGSPRAASLCSRGRRASPCLAGSGCRSR